MKLTNNQSKIIKFALCGFLLLFSFANIIYQNYDITSNRVAGLLVLIISGYMAFSYRNNLTLFTIYFAILYFNYSIVVPVYFSSKNIFIFHLIKDDNIRGIAIYCILVFMIFIALFQRKSSETVVTNTKDNFYLSNNPLNFLNCMIVIVILLGILFIDLRGYSIGAVFEYSIILFILGYYYSGENKSIKILLTLILIIFSLLSFLNGNRVAVLQMLIAFFLIFFNNKLTYKSVLLFATLGILFMTFLGLYGDGIPLHQLSFKNVLNIFGDRFFALDTSYSAFFTSLTFVMVKEFVSFSTEIVLFVKFMLSMIFGGSIVEDSSLPLFTRNYMIHYNGGVLPIYFYFYLGWLGMLIPAGLLNFFTKQVKKMSGETKDHVKLVVLYIASTVPRWYLYSPSSLVRGVMIFYVAYFIFLVLDNTKKVYLIKDYSNKEVN